MATVRIEPLGIIITVAPDETLMDAAERQGLLWPTECGGQGMCTACAVEVVSGSDHLSPPRPWERDTLAEAELGPAARLACQVRASGDAVVRKCGVVLAQ